MHETTILVTWLVLHVAGGIVTLLMPWIFPDTSRQVEERDNVLPISAYEKLEESSPLMVYGDKAA
ncbi:MAG: hypothetical protein KF876_05955 [Nitrospira sp.]|nr:hypothetical protein [Nitrospira sp.]MBX3333648.1 hypothetical protein [Nitrospira sp.]MDR4463217.1 hypothetical protein [Nitrospira sp.]MDR4469291.1 hypothetical protein [Nitrospira sp.]